VQRAKRQRFLPHNAEEAGRPGASSSGWYWGLHHLIFSR
jgi:hypothetical protein